MTPLRARLFRPDNAVPDTGFNFKNGKPVKAPGGLVQRSFEARAPLTPFSVVTPPAGFSGHQRIITTVCKVFDLKLDELLSEQRNVWVAEARQVAMALVVRLTKKSAYDTARLFNRNHTTVAHAIEKMRPHINEICARMPPESTLEWVIALKERMTDPEVVKARKSRHYNLLRTVTHCINGHPFDEANTIIRKDGFRRCRTCKNQIDRLRFHRRKAERPEA
jgi:hypothetical protein